MGDVEFSPVTTPLPTCLDHMGTQLDFALISPRIAPWLSIKILTPHGSDHLPGVFSLQKTAKKQNIKPHNPFRYEKSGSDVI